jgi:hypothetical protein
MLGEAYIYIYIYIYIYRERERERERESLYFKITGETEENDRNVKKTSL